MKCWRSDQCVQRVWPRPFRHGCTALFLPLLSHWYAGNLILPFVAVCTARDRDKQWEVLPFFERQVACFDALARSQRRAIANLLVPLLNYLQGFPRRECS